MRKTSLALAVAASTLGLSQVAFADLVGDTKVSLEARNFYFNRDFRQGNSEVPAQPQSKQEEWAQGFILRMNSGFTEGTVGFGADAIGMFGFKLDSGGGVPVAVVCWFRIVLATMVLALRITIPVWL